MARPWSDVWERLTPERVEAFIQSHPGGATGQEVADYIGVTRQRIEQMVSAALDKLRRRLEREGLSLADLLPDRVGSEGTRRVARPYTDRDDRKGGAV